jgi:cyclopropane fatty-acyl-phospholipid synthase-like methyltransferase
MKYEKASRYDPEYVTELIMGPNPIKLLEELCSLQPIAPEDNVLDLGCGRGLTSMFIAREYGARVIAADLWISPGENKVRFEEAGLTDRIIPIRAEAHDLPFAEEYFDIVTCVDAYHYFGLDPDYLGSHLLPLLKRGGHLLIAVPGLKRDIHDDIPAEMLLSWRPEDIETLHDADHWREIVSAAQGAEIAHLAPMESFEECWDDWLACDNEYAVHDRKAMAAGAGRYMNFIAIILRRK